MADAVRINRAAAMLLAVRHGGAVVRGLGDAAPADEAEAWAVQQEVLLRRNGRIGGYKCATPAGKAPSAALLDAAGLHPSPARWPVATARRSASRPRSPSASGATCRRARRPMRARR